MSNGDQQIVSAYEDAKMSPEEISEDFGFELEHVKLCLLQNSKVFYDENKALVKQGETPLFNDQDLLKAKKTMEACLYSEEDGVRFRASKFIIDEAKGRHDLTQLKQVNISITQIQQQARRAQDAIQRAKQLSSSVAPLPTPAPSLTIEIGVTQ